MSASKEREKPVTVLIVDDHPLVREGLGVYLRSRNDIQLVGEAASGEEAVALCDQLLPDMVLMDVVMPGMDGVTATREIVRAHPATQVIALTSFYDRKTVKAAFEAGAIGYLIKDISGADLVDAIKAARAGRPPLAAEAAQALISCALQPDEPVRDLTQREMQVLAMMAEGLNNAEIAKKLFVSRSTVKAHVSRILTKLEVSSRTEAVSVALREQMVE
jgi:NarL family two-component system response regulator LiaR